MSTVNTLHTLLQPMLRRRAFSRRAIQQRIIQARPLRRLGVLLLTAGVIQSAHAAPITFLTALAVSQGEAIVREQLLYRRDARDPSLMQRNMQVSGAVTALAYGVTPDFAFFGVVPLLDKRLHLTLPNGARATRVARGLGDVMAFGRYTFLHDDGPGYTLRSAWFAGTTAPTGEDNAQDTLGRLPPPLQLGSGGWNPLAGVTVTYQTLDYEFDSAASYQRNTEANGFKFGDVAELDASLQYRLLPRRLGTGLPHFLYGVLEANLIHQDKNRSQGVTDPDSGGTTLFLSPGLQYVTPRWVWEASVQVPVIQNLNGSALKNNYILWAGFRRNFGL